MISIGRALRTAFIPTMAFISSSDAGEAQTINNETTTPTDAALIQPLFLPELSSENIAELPAITSSSNIDTPSFLCPQIESMSATGDLFTISSPEANTFIMQPRFMGLDGTTWNVAIDFKNPEVRPSLSVVWQDGNKQDIPIGPDPLEEFAYLTLFEVRGESNISYDTFTQTPSCYAQVDEDPENSNNVNIQVGCITSPGHFSSFTISETFTDLAVSFEIPIAMDQAHLGSCIYDTKTPGAGEVVRYVLP